MRPRLAIESVGELARDPRGRRWSGLTPVTFLASGVGR